MTLPGRILLWGAVGLVLGTSLDALHVLTGAVIYPPPVFGLQPWWVPLLYTGAGLALGFGHRWMAGLLGGAPPANGREAVAGTALLVVVYGSSGFLKEWPSAALGIYLALFAAAAVLTRPGARRILLAHALGAGVAGPLVEWAISSAGGFRHAHPDFMNVPRWLPAIYLHAAVASAAVDRWLLARVGVRGHSTH